MTGIVQVSGQVGLPTDPHDPVAVDHHGTAPNWDEIGAGEHLVGEQHRHGGAGHAAASMDRTRGSMKAYETSTRMLTTM